MIEIPGVARPSPTPDPDAGCARRVLESSAVSQRISEQSIAHSMLVIECTRLRGRVLLEDVLHRDAFARRCPHIRHVEVFRSVIVVVKTADAHPRADIFHSCLPCNVDKSSIAIVAVKILSAEIVYHVKVGPAIPVEVAPPASKAVARVVLVEPRLGSHVAERAVPLVAHHEIGRPVVGVIIRRRILVLVGALVVDVEAEVDIQPAVAVIIGNRRSRKGALWRGSELKRIRLLAKLAAALVQEQHRAVCPHHDQILTPVIIDVDQERARCVVEDADTRRLRDVLKRPIASISIKPVRKAARLANIEVVKSIAVDVANGNTVVSVDINAASAVEHGPPIVRSVQKLRSIGGVAAKRRCRDLDIAWMSRPAQGFILPLPTPYSKLLRRGPVPGELPVADALF